MIDVSQWRASIGRWNHCSTTVSRLAKGCQCSPCQYPYHVDGSNTIVVMKTSSVLLTTLFHITVLFFFMISICTLYLPKDIECHCSLHHCQSASFTSMNWDNLIVFLTLHLLLSGDVELNPGPMIDDQPDIFLLHKWLEPLVDWQPFCLLLPGITQQDIAMITKSASGIETEHQSQKLILYCKWINKHPEAKWRDVLNALTVREETELAQNIKDQLHEGQCIGGSVDAATCNPVDVCNKEPVSDLVNGNPNDIFRSHSYKLTDAITTNLYRLTDALHAKGLIPLDTKRDMYSVSGDNELKKAGKLLITLQTLMKSSQHPEQYLIDTCHVLVNQQNQALTDIATSMMKQLGHKCYEADKFNSLPHVVQQYADIMKKQYKQQPVVSNDWPPRIGQGLFFGRLSVVDKQDLFVAQTLHQKSSWFMLKGQIDKVVEMCGSKEFNVEDILQSNESYSPLVVAIDGAAGIGKTTLCRKLLNMWANETLLHHQQYDLVLYCPLRNSKIATAKTLSDLFVCQRYEVPIVTEWFEKRNGEGLLIIFDGWDELCEQYRHSSLAASIICREQLDQCSVIVTSRSYASSSLLEMSSLTKHFEVTGFTEKEISIVIIKTLQNNLKLAQELIDYYMHINSHNNHSDDCVTSEDIGLQEMLSNKDSQLALKLIRDLKVRGDVRSLCYVPLVLSMVILVYCKEGGHLPATLTELYENFILQTIRRHVKRQEADPRTLGSLSSLPPQLAKPLEELCQIAYTNLVNAKMAFSSHELQKYEGAVKEDFFGLMTTFIEYDEEKYQFLHLSIQEFLAALWIAKYEKKTEEVFKDHFDDDQFQLCLRFVAGLTHLEHESYRQYFNKQVDIRCKRAPLFGYKAAQRSWFNRASEIKNDSDFISSDDNKNFPSFLLQLIYESQNTKLCQLLAECIIGTSLCLRKVRLSLFDWLCFSYFINNSKAAWNHLCMEELFDPTLSVLIAGLANKSLQSEPQCKRLDLKLWHPTTELIHKFLQSSLFCNVQKCYCELDNGQFVPCLALLHFFSIPQLKVLHLALYRRSLTSTSYQDEHIELEKTIAKNSTLLEVKISCSGRDNQITVTIDRVIKGISRNKSIESFIINISSYPPLPPPLSNQSIEQLLKDNHTIQALSMNIQDKLFPSSLHISKVSTPLTALEIGRSTRELMTSLIPHIKGLHCLILPEPYPSHLLFLSHPSLRALTLPLDTAESAIELFTILQTNTRLEALKLWIRYENICNSSMGTSLQNMLAENKILKCLQIEGYFCNSFLSFLSNGIKHNSSLQQVTLKHVRLPLNEEILKCFSVVAAKNNITELEIYFKLDNEYTYCNYKEKECFMTQLFYEQGLPAVTNLLQSTSAIKRMRIVCDSYSSSEPKSKDFVIMFYQSIFTHPSLEYVDICTIYNASFLLQRTLKEKIKALIKMHQRKEPHKQVPIVNVECIITDVV